MNADRRFPLRIVAALAALLAGLALYLDGAWNSAMLDRAEQERRAYLIALSKGTTLNPAEEARLAEAYWDRYPDIARDRLYGRKGRLGALGAREHFQNHGRKEGRSWGAASP